ncbi:MAG: 3 exoribonuclease family [Lasallia pustulata]|uniref:Ribosomal RNA-processing protein 42 n=1 Tax=Lasallia pustulata TaxID=136370 RepID=A0A5M8PYR6_9LECA|nr:MAG: 3 exoribonuclease family [Lasallia pustulata]
MAPTTTTTHPLLSPAELSYLHSSLSLHPPIRTDSRSPTQFRPLVAETDILPSTNGSARICFADGTEAIVGVKAEVEMEEVGGGEDMGGGDGEEGKRGEEGWVELTIEIPGCRDDDALPIFLAAMLSEALVAGGELVARLRINARFHWKLYIDLQLTPRPGRSSSSPPHLLPLPLLSLTTHLALLCTRLPALTSEADEDPRFDDDWDASTPLYPRSSPPTCPGPPVTLLVISVAANIIFDPTGSELAVADAVLAVSVGRTRAAAGDEGGAVRVLGVRTIDPPARLTAAGVPDAVDAATGGRGRRGWRARRGRRGCGGRRGGDEEGVVGGW